MIAREEQDTFFKEPLHADRQICEWDFLTDNIRQVRISLDVESALPVFNVKIDDGESKFFQLFDVTVHDV